MQVLLRMSPGLEMWFGEVVWTDEYWDDDEDWPEDGRSFSFYKSDSLDAVFVLRFFSP
jgi:hypothetical protein